jgi:hypothetical protein
MIEKSTSITMRELALIDQALIISDEPATIANATFMFSVFCQLGFPKSFHGDHYFLRDCGKMRLVIDSGTISDGKHLMMSDIPYGAVARLIMSYVCSYAVRYKTPIIELGDSASAFMRKIGLTATGGKNGSLTSVKKQLVNLLSCNIECNFMQGKKNINYCGSIFFENLMMLNIKRKWRNRVILTDGFYEVLVKYKNCVPVDVRAVLALKGSALALDIYLMLSERLHRASKKPTMLYWKNLRDQFGHEYADNNNGKRSFKRNFQIALKKVLLVYPIAAVTQVAGGILIQKSPPPIPKKT